MSTETESFAALCRAGRAILGWSQTELANRTGMGITTIAKIESGLVNPRHDSVMGIFRVFQSAGLVIDSYRTEGGFVLTAPISIFENKATQKKIK